MFAFLIHLLKHGTLRVHPPDFRKEFQDAFSSMPEFSDRYRSTSRYQKTRDRLLRIPYLNTLISNIAYAKSARRLNTQFIVVDSLKLVYLRVLKSGSTSVLAEILPKKLTELENVALNDKQIDLLGNRHGQSALNVDEQHYQPFTVVRNPFRRIVSVYLDLFDPSATEFAYTDYLFGILKKEMSFAEFVAAVAKIPDGLKAPHFVPQSKVIDDSGVGSKLRIFRLEKDQPALREFLGSYDLNWHHHNQRQAYDFRSYYSRELVSVVHKMYQEDIERFGYQQEYEELVRLA